VRRHHLFQLADAELDALGPGLVDVRRLVLQGVAQVVEDGQQPRDKV
jgi:hypothetical protein